MADSTDDRIHKLQETIMSGVAAQKELVVVKIILACLVDMMGGSVLIHSYEYEKYTGGDISLETYKVQDPPGIQLKVKHT